MIINVREVASILVRGIFEQHTIFNLFHNYIVLIRLYIITY